MKKIALKNARRDKRAFAYQMAKEAEEAANKRDMGASQDNPKTVRSKSKMLDSRQGS